MQTVVIPFAGGTYKSLSLPYLAQETKNLFFEVRDGGRSVAALHGFPGLALFATTNGDSDRGMCVHDGKLYKVSGVELWEILTTGVSSLIGTIAGSNQCGMVSDGTNLVITTGATAYYYDGATLNTISDADLETPNTVTYNNSRVIYDGDGGRFCVADVSQPYTIDALNFATAESKPGDVLAVAAHSQYVYIFAEHHIEPWYNSGVGSPPYDRVNGGTFDIGLGAMHSIGTSESHLYFLDEKRCPRRIAGIGIENVGNDGIANIWRGYSTVSDAKGFCFTLQNQNFYYLTFPTANASWLFQEAIGDWVQLTGDVDDGKHQANSYAWFNGTHCVAHHSNGNVYTLDFNEYDSGGDTIIRERVTIPIHGEMLIASAAGKSVFMSRLELVLEAGVGLATGQGSTPQIMMQFSDDGGATWSSELWQSCGVAGARRQRVQWYNLGFFTERIFKFRMTDPVKCSWFSCSADVEIGL